MPPVSPNASTVTELDLRDLSAPEPLLRALAAADALTPGEAVHVLTPLLPLPLLQALTERGLQHRAHALADYGVRVVIERPGDDASDH